MLSACCQNGTTMGRWGNRDRESKLRLAEDIPKRKENNVPTGHFLTVPAFTFLVIGSATGELFRETLA